MIKRLIPNRILAIRSLIRRTQPIAKRQCPICNFSGYFSDYGRPPRLDASCPRCGSLERHRLFWLWYEKDKNRIISPVLHFAAERFLSEIFKTAFSASEYKTADISADSDVLLNIESIDLPDCSINTIICNHVLEHVDDKKALSEMHRILSEKGTLIVSIPIIEGWKETYENPSIQSVEERELHFGQGDHIRYYGSDFRDRLLGAGFHFEEITAEGPEVVTHSLMRGEKIFVCRKHP